MEVTYNILESQETGILQQCNSDLLTGGVVELNCCVTSVHTFDTISLS